MADFPGRLHHWTPGWVQDGALLHIRIRVTDDQSPRLTDPVLSTALLGAAQHYHRIGRWWCELILLMPDHLHALVACPREPGLAMTVRDWKRATARLHRISWQENFFDHRIRTATEGNETWHYIRRNPVVMNLCTAEDAWPHWWSGATNEGGADAGPKVERVVP